MRSVCVVLKNALAWAGLVAMSISCLPAGQSSHLDSSASRVAFRRWFAFLAETRYYARKPLREISDGDSLVRWACRQALAEHDFRWSKTVELPVVPAMPSVGRPEMDAACDAPRFVSRDVEEAQPGDLLVYGQTESAAHVIVYIGASQVVPSAKRWVVYHDGEKLHKVCLDNLRTDPAVEWRPSADTPNFKGVYRFDMLAEPKEVAELGR